QRFSPQPVWAVLLFLAVPAFVVNGNSLESDLPLLAFWMASAALFCGGRWWWAAMTMALAAMTGYQAVVLTPILGIYLLLRKRTGREACPTAWWVILTPIVTVIAWQVFTRLTTGAMPARVLAGYFSTYGFQALEAKLRNTVALFIHSWFIVFPL